MRSIWNGSISFGLVTIPVKTYSATDRTSSVSFARIHAKDGAQIRYRKICELDGEEVPNEEVGKGYQAPDDDAIVQITDEDLARLPMPTAKTLAILAFVDAAEIDPLQMDKAYYLGPNGSSATKPYAVLREALEHQHKVAIGKVAMRGRESLVMLRAHDGAIVMHSLLWPDQIRPATGLGPQADVKIRENELTLAETLMDTLGELDPDELHDDYREAVEQLAAQKLAGGVPVAPDTSGAGGQVIDLMAALEKSVAAAQGGTESGRSASVTPLRGRKTAGKAGQAPAEKTGGTARAATKKAPAKKAAGQKTTAKKAPAKKTATAKESATAKKATGKAAARSSASAARTGTGTSAKAGAKSAAKKAPAKRTGKKASA